MQAVYSLAIKAFQYVLPLTAGISDKMRDFVQGRKGVFQLLEQEISGTDKTIWFHTASLGEYEQAVPVIKEIKNKYPGHKILVTFFSPSGYNNKKNNNLADVVTYLPLDTPSNARRFLELARPEMVFFVKYEFWPNFLISLKAKGVRTFLISGVFRESQPFFKWYGGFMKKALTTFEYFFLQDKVSLANLDKLGFKNAVVSGDTRFDRVSRQLEMDNTVDFLERFIGENPVLVCGSTWPEDDALLIDFLNSTAVEKNIKVIIAPHEIKEEKIQRLIAALQGKAIRFSSHQDKTIEKAHYFILDTVGYLGRAYSYADVAYVGGAAGETGLHNILEAATFGIPIITGAHIDKFPEAIRLRSLAGLYTVTSSAEAKEILDRFFADAKFRNQTGMIAGHFVQQNTGATRAIMQYLN
ncbi:MAG: 3-deoxy-D-manno-octulosonic acid transferase [Cytophagaceae bacterium]|nr:3-deoxy-D-manno-octulosonic acid transferase [Cytophagaceae bacterium]|tara:strand:- start:2436 stop:3671 length:1236 start_codon:yes stop_codon:yes gene_type:complete